MRKLILLAAIGIISIAAQPARAQVTLNVNIGSQPQWGPTGYNHVDYYYLPEIESYYSVPTRQFIYLSGNRWVHNRRLPARYRNYNLHNGRKIVINSPRPYLRHVDYRKQYNRPVYTKNYRSYPSRGQKNYRHKYYRQDQGKRKFDKKHDRRGGKHMDRNHRGR